MAGERDQQLVTAALADAAQEATARVTAGEQVLEGSHHEAGHWPLGRLGLGEEGGQVLAYDPV